MLTLGSYSFLWLELQQGLRRQGSAGRHKAADQQVTADDGAACLLSQAAAENLVESHKAALASPPLLPTYLFEATLVRRQVTHDRFRHNFRALTLAGFDGKNAVMMTITRCSTMTDGSTAKRTSFLLKSYSREETWSLKTVDAGR